MNDYDSDNDNDNDNDGLDDLSSSGNSFRARSNTWPLNRPDFAAPSSNVCIDEPLPEIELEEDDLFTTNENWSAGFVDHDIMSWDPILNAQTQQSQQQLQASNQHPILHHQPPTNQQTTNHVQEQHQAPQGHQRQQSIHLNHHQQPLQHHPQQHINQHNRQNSPTIVAQHQQRPHPPSHHHQHNHQPHHGPHDGSFLDANNGAPNNSDIMIAQQNAASQQSLQQPQQSQQQSPLQLDQSQHQTLNSSRCLDTDDPNECHIHQLHHLHLDGGPNDHQQEHYSTPIGPDGSAPISIPTNVDPTSGNQYGIGISSDHHHHQHHHHHHHQHQQSQHHSHQPRNHPQSHLQSLSSARYDFDNQHQQHHHHHQQQQNDYNIKLTQDDNLNNQHNLSHLDQHLHNHLHHQHHPSDPTMPQLHHPQFGQHSQQHIHSHHYHDLDNSIGASSTSMLSSSLNTGNLGLGVDLEDLDYKPTILDNYDDSLQHVVGSSSQQQTKSDLKPQSSETIKSDNSNMHSSSSAGAQLTKQSDSTSASKTKLNAPRRNAWGNMSYADLISQAIESTSDKRLTLSQIYDWMVQHVPYFKDKGDSNSSAGWKNSVRHNLSLHSRFKRLQNEGTGKSSWWTINPEANIGKCARRRAASMEASKYEKKRGKAKKRAEAIRQGLVSYPSLTNSSLNGSTNTLGEQQSQAQSLSQFHSPSKTTTSATNTTTAQLESSTSQQQQQSQESNLQSLDQFADQLLQQQQQQQSPPQTRQQFQIQTLENFNIDHPSKQQQLHLRRLQQADQQEQQQQYEQLQNCVDNDNLQNDIHHGYVLSQQISIQQSGQQLQPQDPQQVTATQYQVNDDNGKLQQQSQSQYYYQQFELSTAL